MRHRTNVKKIKNIALERIDILMNLAEEEAKQNRMNRARRYVELSRKIAMKIRMPFPKKWKRRICKKCGTFLVFGKNARVRIKSNENPPNVMIKCLECGNIVRIPIIREKKLKRKKNPKQ
ncbi:ribonuclease P protein component 4 [Methanothermococcus okinawensis]|uniref:Ribonuclease P protein component 4 n=1 Tax=Methanothermococcus okinawensis (strain DSM 14208 / JCM 11175 / IH1) TaxID=647113 RepID=F8ALU3_METOI|nr:ribonuclease P protein component 4 [Methanothermococcus okinawensis]AEH07390.1 Ribonuclease P protein component 4 [Methanothermococcus okinawensis IH1]